MVLDDDDIVRVTVREGAHIDAPEIRAFLDARMQLAPHRVPILIDQRRIRSMTRAAQEESTRGAEQRPTVCVAILVEGPVTVMIGNFFIIVGRPHYPTRLFASEAEARAWIERKRGEAVDGG